MRCMFKTKPYCFKDIVCCLSRSPLACLTRGKRREISVSKNNYPIRSFQQLPIRRTKLASSNKIPKCLISCTCALELV